MKYIIFGTGIYYENLKKYIKNEDIYCFADNNVNKQGQYLDGKLIYSPHEIDFSKCEYILVLIMRSDSVFEQLKGLGVQKEKIISFYDLGEFLGINSEVNVLGKKVLFSDWVKDKRNVLIVCHELTRNGVSVVLMHTAILLRKMGYHVVLSGLIGGGLEQELGQLGIDFISDISVCYRSKKFRDVALKMDFIILGTVGLADVANTFRETEVPIFLDA